MLKSNFLPIDFSITRISNFSHVSLKTKSPFWIINPLFSAREINSPGDTNFPSYLYFSNDSTLIISLVLVEICG